MKLASVAVRTVADRAVVQAVATELSSAAVHSPEESIRKAGLLGVGALFSDPDVLKSLVQEFADAVDPAHEAGRYFEIVTKPMLVPQGDGAAFMNAIDAGNRLAATYAGLNVASEWIGQLSPGTGDLISLGRGIAFRDRFDIMESGVKVSAHIAKHFFGSYHVGPVPVPVVVSLIELGSLLTIGVKRVQDQAKLRDAVTRAYLTNTTGLDSSPKALTLQSVSLSQLPSVSAH